ncbi:uncharacterized protein BX663DRAFT_500967 [Cokeromyces recurvatus]|uniref:uncharacterized protein n=1 Tax=Cokeromyces recurvatus TaxID=90255 RepID=UPI0022203E3F|nr:uncharacterized protein BX663DRAFT_500967 [Cokeromyces recurvatus]KAI7905806.1 hypothetical protein BX663DRAFT_500967 [Cokeromyces recurvatus]
MLFSNHKLLPSAPYSFFQLRMVKKSLNSAVIQELKKNPSLDYFSFAKAKNRNMSRTNLTYSIILERVIKNGTQKQKKIAKKQKDLFSERKKENSDFASEYKRYWTQYTAQDLNQKLSDIASNAALSLSEITWSYIEDNTRRTFGQTVVTNPLQTASDLSPTDSNYPSTASSSPPISSTNNPDNLQSFLEYSEDLENDLLSMYIIDLSDTVTVNVLEQTLNKATYDEINNDCILKAYPLTNECRDLLERISSCPPALSPIRKLLMNYVEFSNNSKFDPYLHNDYEFIHDIVFHFLKLCESPMNPISQTLKERTAATWISFPIINSLFLQFQDIIEFKWIEVLHLDLDNSKIDGLAIERKSKSMVIIIEFAGGSNTHTETKLESDCIKIYKNAIKSLKNDVKKKRLFTVLYYNNTIFFESLTIHNEYYVRKRHLELSMPQNPRGLKSFAALLPTVLSWRQAVIDSVE